MASEPPRGAVLHNPVRGSKFSKFSGNAFPPAQVCLPIAAKILNPLHFPHVFYWQSDSFRNGFCGKSCGFRNDFCRKSGTVSNGFCGKSGTIGKGFCGRSGSFRNGFYKKSGGLRYRETRVGQRTLKEAVCTEFRGTNLLNQAEGSRLAMKKS